MRASQKLIMTFSQGYCLPKAELPHFGPNAGEDIDYKDLVSDRATCQIQSGMLAPTQKLTNWVQRVSSIFHSYMIIHWEKKKKVNWLPSFTRFPPATIPFPFYACLVAFNNSIRLFSSPLCSSVGLGLFRFTL